MRCSCGLVVEAVGAVVVRRSFFVALDTTARPLVILTSSQPSYHGRQVMHALLLAVLFAAQPAGGERATPLEIARHNYEVKLEAATKKVNADYVKELQGLLKKAMAKNDAELTEAIMAELKQFKKTKAGTAKKQQTPSIVGEWNMIGGVRFYKPDGASYYANGKIAGKWRLVDSDARKYQLYWFEGGRVRFVDTGTLSEDGNTFRGTNNEGNPVSGTRAIEIKIEDIKDK